jgi:uncharacterized membrane protein YdjX (TVP38/TMEM64 family)
VISIARVTGSKKLFALLRLAALPIIVLIAVFVAWKLGYFELDSRRKLIDTVQRLRVVPYIEPAFLVAYALVILICLPATVFTVLGGAIFGPWIGALLSWGGSMLGTVITHWLAKSVAQKPLHRLFGEHKILKILKEHDDVPALFRLRVIPIAPFAVMDYAAGLAGVSLRRLLAATAVGVIPSVVAYAYVGSQLLSSMVSKGEASKRGLWIALGITLLMFLISVVPGLLRRLRD